ncbi:uncharacterized protein LOC132952496 [Metopolophium dirhodum]|uniref:uncharacterized protein LOC132952496 n=1 Tax=Metopolophium dirhodum TaxID=44670 RepID=UPI0029900717|nr:uncharacterized protein LOC132952496 [Metopolophium dirhodum]
MKRLRINKMLKAATAAFEPKRLTYGGNMENSNTMSIANNDYLQDKVQTWLETNNNCITVDNTLENMEQLDCQIYNDSDNYFDPNTIEFLIDDDNINDSNAILNTEIPSEIVNHTESNIIQPPIIIVVPQLEVANASTDNMEELILDPEYSENIEVVNGGRKRQKINKRKIDQYNRNIIKPGLVINCIHKDKPFCKVSEIDPQCLNIFKENLRSLKSKIDQDKFIIAMMTVQKPLKTDRRKINETKNNLTDRNTIKYFIPTKEGKIPVCAAVFSSITSISRKRLNIIAKNFQLDLCSPKEKRGGKHENPIDQKVTESIIEHITLFKAKKNVFPISKEKRLLVFLRHMKENQLEFLY